MQADPRTLARGTVAQAPHTRADPVNTLGHPGENYAGSAHVGGHTVEALAQHGYFEAEIERFVAEGPLVAEKP